MYSYSYSTDTHNQAWQSKNIYAGRRIFTANAHEPNRNDIKKLARHLHDLKEMVLSVDVVEEVPHMHW